MDKNNSTSHNVLQGWRCWVPAWRWSHAWWVLRVGGLLFSMVWWYLWWCSNRWIGYGGSVFQWHPKLNIGFAFTPTLLEYHCFFNKKAARMQVGRQWTNKIYQIYKHLPNNSGRGCALCRETGSCKERPVDESQRTWNQCKPLFLISTHDLNRYLELFILLNIVWRRTFSLYALRMWLETRED